MVLDGSAAKLYRSKINVLIEYFVSMDTGIYVDPINTAVNPLSVFGTRCTPVLSTFLIGRMFVREPSWEYSANLVGS